MDKLFDLAYPEHKFPKWEELFATTNYPRGPWQTQNECGLAILRFLQWYNGDKIQCKDEEVNWVIFFSSYKTDHKLYVVYIPRKIILNFFIYKQFDATLMREEYTYNLVFDERNVAPPFPKEMNDCQPKDATDPDQQD